MRTGDGERLRRQKFRELLRTPWYQAVLVLVPCAVLVGGAAWGSAPIAIGGCAVAAGLILLVGHGHAANQARESILSGFAAARGLTYHDEIDPPRLTPLLIAGDEQRMDCAMLGLLDGMPLGLGHFTYTEIKHTTDSDGHTRTEREHHHFTVAWTDVEAAMAALPTLHLRPRSKLLDWGSGWLRTNGLDKAETESVRFNERFKLWHREAQDPVVLRRFLDPSVVDALATHPLRFGVEISAGTLLVYLEDHCSDSGELAGLVDLLRSLRGWLLDAARAGGVSAPAPASHGPPAG